MEELQKIKVLYLEDEDTIRTLFTQMLRRKVKEIIAVSNGKEGLEALKNFQPDVIITDLEMPILGGVDFLKEIRSLGLKIPSIIMSGNDTDNLENCSDYILVKPVDKRVLFEILQIIATAE